LLCFVFLAVTGCANKGSAVTGEVVFGTGNTGEGDKVVVLLDGEGKSYSGDADATGKFTIPDVAPGTYKVKVMHYVAVLSTPDGKPATKGPPGIPNKGVSSGPPAGGPGVPREYPEEWTVPGGPYKLDMSKLKK